jgi:hypothetical protein
MPGADRRVRGDVALVGSRCDTREVSQDAVQPGLKLIMQDDEVNTKLGWDKKVSVVEVIPAAPHGTDCLLVMVILPGGKANATATMVPSAAGLPGRECTP